MNQSANIRSYERSNFSNSPIKRTNKTSATMIPFTYETTNISFSSTPNDPIQIKMLIKDDLNVNNPAL